MLSVCTLGEQVLAGAQLSAAFINIVQLVKKPHFRRPQLGQFSYRHLSMRFKSECEILFWESN